MNLLILVVNTNGKMISFTDNGIYCRQGDFYVDPWKPAAKALITHGHSDHARWGSAAYLCHLYTVPILKLRLGNDISVQGVEYGETIFINGVKVSFHPAGHIIGSAQIRLEYKGEVWVISGDYKLGDDLLSTPFELVKCQHFVTESTFGLPVYDFQSAEKIYQDINEWCKTNATDGFNSVLLGYALGKSQAVLHSLSVESDKVFLHGAVANVNTALSEVGFRFKGKRIMQETVKGELKEAVVVAPPSALGTPWLKKLQPCKIAICSGWMALRGARRRYGVDKGFALSDHCDWQQLNDAVVGTGAEHVYVTHGYETAFVRWLKEKYLLDAYEVKTLFNNRENEEDL